MTILANGGRNLNDRGTSKGGNLERVQLGGVTSTIQVENLGGKKVIVNSKRSLCSNRSLVLMRHFVLFLHHPVWVKNLYGT